MTCLRNSIPDKVWDSDYVQFPRLISALLLHPEQQIDLCRVLGMSPHEFSSILARAREKWKRILEAYKEERKHGHRRKAARQAAPALLASHGTRRAVKGS